MQGLLEDKKIRLYFSGRVKKRSSDFDLEVDKILIADWKRGGDDGLVVVSHFNDTRIHYKVADTSKLYKKALEKIFVVNTTL